MLISAVMPTRGRQALAAEALACFRSQDYPHRELVIVDDAGDPSFPTPPDIPGVHYYRLSQRLTIGAKRNICCSRAEGEVICHWDDDDHSAPGRLSDQIARLGSYAVTGYYSMRFTDGTRWWQYTGAPDYALGTSLMYTRAYWESNPFKTDCTVGEDGHFIALARQSGQIISADAGEMMFARNHAGNTDKREGMKNTLQWREIA